MFKIANAISLFSIGQKAGSLFGETASSVSNSSNMPTVQNGSFFSVIGGEFWLSLWNSIASAFGSFIFLVVKFILNIVDFLQFFVKHLIGLDYWESGKVSAETLGESDVIFKFLYNETVQRAFKYMLGIFVVLLIIFSIIAIIKNEYAIATDAKSSTTLDIIKSSAKAIFLVVLVPVLLVMGLLASNAVLAGICNAFKLGNNLTLGGQVFTSSAYDASRYRNYADNDLRYAVSNSVNVTVEGEGTARIETTVIPVVPKDFTSSNQFVGFMFVYKGVNYLYSLGTSSERYAERKQRGVDNYEFYVKYFTNIMGVELKQYNDVGAQSVEAGKPYLMRASLNEKTQDHVLNRAAYNSWDFNSIYYQHNQNFENTVSSEIYKKNGVEGFQADSGHTYSDARLFTNNDVWGTMHDGGENGLVALKEEYYVMADLIDFAISNVTSIAFVNVKSSAIDWEYSGKDGKGYLNSKFVKTNRETGNMSLNSFVVNYKESGYVVYDTSRYVAEDKTAETDGVIYIAAYYSSSKGKYIPIVNNVYYVDDYGEALRFSSDYLDSNYQGLIVARGVLDSEFKNQSGYPTEIDISWGSNSSEGSISTDTPKYYLAQAETVKMKAVLESNPTALKFRNNTVHSTDKNDSVEIDASFRVSDNIDGIGKSLPTSFKIRYSGKDRVDNLTNTPIYSKKNITYNDVSWSGDSSSGITGYDAIFKSSKNITYRDISTKNVTTGTGTTVVLNEETESEYALYACVKFESNVLSVTFKAKKVSGSDSNTISVNVLSDVSGDIGIYPEKYNTYKVEVGGSGSPFKAVKNGVNLELESVKVYEDYYDAIYENATMLAKYFDVSASDYQCTNIETNGDEVYYYYMKNGGTQVYRITYNMVDHSLELYANQKFNFKIGENVLKVSGSNLSYGPYEMDLQRTYREGTNIFCDYEINHEKTTYVFKFQYTHDSDGYETYVPVETNALRVVLDKYNLYSYVYKNGTDGTVKKLNPVNGEIIHEVESLQQKVAYVQKSSIYATRMGKDENKNIFLITVKLQDEDQSTFASFYVKTDETEANKVVGTLETTAENINESYAVGVDARTLSKLPEYTNDDAEEIKKLALSTTSTVIFKREKVKSNAFFFDFDVGLFSKKTWRFKLKFFDCFSKNEYVTSSFKIIGGSIRLDYNFTSSFASGLNVGVFFNPAKLNIVVLVFASCLLLSIMGKAVWGVVQRIFDITVYFLILPGVASVIPFDGGNRFSTWTKNVTSKVLGAYGVMIGLNLFFILLPPIKSISHLFTADDLATLSEGNFLSGINPTFINSLSELLFTLVALTMIQTLPSLISTIVGGEDIVKTGEGTMKAVKDMSKNVGDTLSGKKVIDARNTLFGDGKNKGMLRSFVPGSAIYDDIKAKTGLGKKKNSENPVEESEAVAKSAAEARRRADAESMMASADERMAGATPGTATASTEATTGTTPDATATATATAIPGATTGEASATGVGGLGASAESSAEIPGVKPEDATDGSADEKNEVSSESVEEIGEETAESVKDVADDAVEKVKDLAGEKVKENPEEYEELADEAQKEIDELEKDLAEKNAERSKTFANTGDYYGYNDEGKFVYRNADRETEGITDAEEKRRISEDVRKYNAAYDEAVKEHDEYKSVIGDLKDEKQSYIDEASRLREAQANKENTEEKPVEEKPAETAETAVKAETAETAVKAETAETVENAEETKASEATSNDAESAKRYAEASKLYAEASKGFADIATGKVDKNYGVENKTRDQKKLDALLEKRQKRLEDQEAGNGDTGLALIKRRKAYDKFNEGKDAKDSIFDKNEKVTEAAIEEYNKKHGTKLDKKNKKDEKQIEQAVQEWKDERARELYNKKKGTNFDKLDDGQLAEARQLLNTDQYIKKATARSQYKDEKIDKQIAKQQEKMELKANGLYESWFKKGVLYLPRQLTRKSTEKDEQKIAKKLDKWEQRGLDASQKVEELRKKKLESGLSDEENTTLTEKEKELAHARRRYDVYSAQLQNGRSGLIHSFARETKNGARAVKSKLQDNLIKDLNKKEDNLISKGVKMDDKMSTFASGFKWNDYLDGKTKFDTANAKFTDKQKSKMQARANAVSQASSEKSIGQNALLRKGLVLKSDGSVDYDKSKAKLGKDYSKRLVNDYYKKYKAYDEKEANAKRKFSALVTDFNVANRTSFVKLDTRLDRRTLARVKAEKAKVVSEFNNASRSGRLDEFQEKDLLGKIQGYDSTIDMFSKKTTRYKAPKSKKLNKQIEKLTVATSGASEAVVEATTKKVKKLTNKDLARQFLAGSADQRKTQISERDKAALEKTAEKIGRAEARRSFHDDATQKEYINKIRKALAQSGYAGDVTSITNTTSAKAVRDQLESNLLAQLKKQKQETLNLIKKDGKYSESELAKLRDSQFNEKLIEQKLRKLKKVDLDISALGDNANIRKDIKEMTDRTMNAKFRNEYKDKWNSYLKNLPSEMRGVIGRDLGAKSGPKAYEKSMGETKRLKGEIAGLSKDLERMKAEGKTSTLKFTELTEKLRRQEKLLTSIQDFNKKTFDQFKATDETMRRKLNKTYKSSLTMEKIMKDMRRESKYKIKQKVSGDDKK